MRAYGGVWECKEAGVFKDSNKNEILWFLHYRVLFSCTSSGKWHDKTIALQYMGI